MTCLLERNLFNLEILLGFLNSQSSKRESGLSFLRLYIDSPKGIPKNFLFGLGWINSSIGSLFFISPLILILLLSNKGVE